MNKRATVLVAILLLGCAPKEDRHDLKRRPVGVAARDGWARLTLDASAQQAFPDLWLGDRQGLIIPFEVEHEGLWQPHPLGIEKFLPGRTAGDQSAAEFTLKLPGAWQAREGEHLTLNLDLEGEAPWVARVEVERSQGGAFLKLEQPSPLHVFDLGRSGRQTAIDIPWEARSYRVTLAAAEGKAPRIKGVSATAGSLIEDLEADRQVAPEATMTVKEGAEVWLLKLPEPDRVVGADFLLKPPLNPIRIQVRERCNPGGPFNTM